MELFESHPILPKRLVCVRDFSAIAYHVQGRRINGLLEPLIIESSEYVDEWFIYSNYKWKAESSPFTSIAEELDAIHSPYMDRDPRVKKLFDIERRNSQSINEINGLLCAILNIDNSKADIFINCKNVNYAESSNAYLRNNNDIEAIKIAKKLKLKIKNLILMPSNYEEIDLHYPNLVKVSLVLVDELVEIRKVLIERDQKYHYSHSTNGRKWKEQSGMIITDDDIKFANAAKETAENLFRFFNN